MDSDIQSVQELNTWLKQTVEAQTDRQRIRVRGMAWNVRHNRNGHLRFQLRHGKHSLPVIVLSIIAQRMPFRVENMQQLIVEGKIEVYRPWGELQLVAQTVEVEEQVGPQEALSVLKARAEAEGWLDSKRKRKLPPEPIKIGLITGGGSLAREDVMGSLKDEEIQCTVLPITASVEGPEAAQNIRDRLDQANQHPSDLDLIVLARGGGPTASLWIFNDWALAEAIVQSRAPVLTAIGHREDETLADLVADRRAHTPSLVGSVLAQARPKREDQPAQPVAAKPETPVQTETPASAEPSRQWVTVLVTVLATLLLAVLAFVVFAWILGWP